MAKKKLRRDLNETAFDVMRAATGEASKRSPPGIGDKNPEAVARGRKGGQAPKRRKRSRR